MREATLRIKFAIVYNKYHLDLKWQTHRLVQFLSDFLGTGFRIDQFGPTG